MTPEQRFSFDVRGYLVIPDVLPADALREVNAAFDRAYDTWLANPSRPGGRRATEHQIQSIIEYDDLFLDLMEHPRTFPCARAALGYDIQLLDADGIVRPPHTAAHTRWHFDESLLGVHQPGSTMMVKVFFALTDFTADNGATAIVRGTHRFPNGYPFPRVERVEDMPEMEQIIVRAGDAFLFHGHCYHTAMPNRTDRPRRGIAYNYGHFYMKHWGGNEPSAALRARATTAVRRQLLGIGDPYSQYLKDE